MGAKLPQLAAWIGGTVDGVLGGNFTGDAEKLGLDVIFSRPSSSPCSQTACRCSPPAPLPFSA